MRILDRYILKNFLFNYLLALCVLIGIFVLLDLIVNIQDFARGAVAATPGTSTAKVWDILGDMADYYFYQLPLIFQAVSGIVPLVAAGFTMMRMTRHYELTAILSSGVSLYRVAAPIILASLGLMLVSIANQEFVIAQPFVIQKLLRPHSGVNMVASKSELLMFVKDTDGSLLSATEYYTGRDVDVTANADGTFSRTSGSFVDDGLMPGFVITTAHFKNDADNGQFRVAAVTPSSIKVEGRTLAPDTGGMLSTGAAMKNVFIVRRDAYGTPINHTRAASSHWEPIQVDPSRPDLENAWVLRAVETVDDTAVNPDARRMDVAFRSTALSPEQIDLILSKKAVDYLSSARLHELARSSPDVSQPLLYKMMHLRFTQPMMNIILLLIGIPFLLTRDPKRLIYSIGICIVICGTIFIATFVIFQMGGTQINPLWAAWLPVLIFGPLAAVMMDTIKT